MKRTLRNAVLATVVAATFGLAGAIDLNVFVAGDTIRAADMNANFSDLAAAIEAGKTMAFPAQALSFDPASAVITRHAGGLSWTADFAAAGSLIIPRPADWDRTSDVTLEVYFYPTTNASGAVDFFIRPTSYSVGDVWGDTPSLNSPAAVVSGSSRLAKMSFTVPATTFASGELWFIRIQRGGSNETYLDRVVLVSVVIRYSSTD